jgi:nitrite reductase/ring-hydroxylating ferredoxin subunit
MAKISVKLGEVEDGKGQLVPVDERTKIALFRVGDRFAAINNRCPHAGASLCDGEFDGTIVKCPLHGFRVDVWKGVGNAGKPVKSYPVEVQGDEILITIPDPA